MRLTITQLNRMIREKKDDGAGRDFYKWVSFLTDHERQAVREGHLVVVLGASTHGGNPAYRRVIFRAGRYVQRVPDAEECGAIDAWLEEDALDACDARLQEALDRAAEVP